MNKEKELSLLHDRLEKWKVFKIDSKDRAQDAADTLSSVTNNEWKVQNSSNWNFIQKIINGWGHDIQGYHFMRLIDEDKPYGFSVDFISHCMDISMSICDKILKQDSYFYMFAHQALCQIIIKLYQFKKLILGNNNLKS